MAERAAVQGIGWFGDARRAAAGAFVLERIVETGSLVIRKVGGDRAGEMMVHRFLSSPAVQVSEIVETVAARTAAACAGRVVVAVQDTTEINFAGRELARVGLGPAGDGKSLGFFVHPVLAVDAADEALLGVVDLQIWSRSPGPKPAPRRQRGLAEKESQRWLTAAQVTAERLAGAARVVMVGDRENDIYGFFAQRPNALDLVVRVAQDRALVDGERLFAAAAGWPELGRAQVKVAPRGPGDRGRIAEVALRAGPVTVRRPRNGYDPADPPALGLSLVEVREVGEPAAGKPLLWRLFTTLPVTDLAAVEQIVQFYRLRWRIEQTFRALKSDGLALEDAQLHERERLFKLATIALVAAARTIQLVDARDGSSRPATDVLDPALIEVADAIGKTKEGRTARQQNPHPKGSLAWLAWIIARLGGWNCYYKPPGPKTMRSGWNQFAAMAAGYLIAKHGEDL